MRKLKENYPIWCSVILTVLFLLMLKLMGKPLSAVLPAYGGYLPQMAADLLIVVIGALIALLLGMSNIFRPGGKGAGECIRSALPILVFYVIGAAWLILNAIQSGYSLAGPDQIVVFVSCMLAVGMAEELFLRGLAMRMIFEKYGKNAKGVWLSVLVPSLLFGAMHLGNAIGGNVPFSSAMFQAVSSGTMGMCFAAIYLRTNSIWAMALLHGFMDFCTSAASGLFGTQSLMEGLASYGSNNLTGAVLWVLVALFLLRPKKMKEILEDRSLQRPDEISV